VEGLARLIAEKPAVDNDRLAHVLGRSTPGTILGSVESMRSTYKANARVVAIAGLYDRGLGEARKLRLG